MMVMSMVMQNLPFFTMPLPASFAFPECKTDAAGPSRVSREHSARRPLRPTSEDDLQCKAWGSFSPSPQSFLEREAIKTCQNWGAHNLQKLWHLTGVKKVSCWKSLESVTFWGLWGTLPAVSYSKAPNKWQTPRHHQAFVDENHGIRYHSNVSKQPSLPPFNALRSICSFSSSFVVPACGIQDSQLRGVQEVLVTWVWVKIWYRKYWMILDA